MACARRSVMVSRRLAWFVVVFGLVCLIASVSVGGVLAATLPPVDQPAMGCFWEWVGPGTGWVKVSDGCGGHCSPPNYAGSYIGQQEVTLCDPPQ